MRQNQQRSTTELHSSPSLALLWSDVTTCQGTLTELFY